MIHLKSALIDGLRKRSPTVGSARLLLPYRPYRTGSWPVGEAAVRAVLMIVGSNLQTFDPVVGFTAGGENNNGKVGGLGGILQRFTDGVSIHMRKQGIEDDNIGTISRPVIPSGAMRTPKPALLKI
jgi:hypothetical protein